MVFVVMEMDSLFKEKCREISEKKFRLNYKEFEVG